ncbi:hypothetical protein GTO27_06630 [Candidatus Bathyarchaeota archaeon]|nr:hypothetical protein [Candidatus Bathyarchaeota archaeon]
MPIFVEWKWQERTKTFLTVFHFWDNGEEANLRVRIEEEGFEFMAPEGEKRKEFVQLLGLPYHGDLAYPETNAYLSWAPSHPEFCFLTELLTYANLINGMKPILRRNFRAKLEGKATKVKDKRGHEWYEHEVHSELLEFVSKKRMAAFTKSEGVSFEVCLEYLEYLRKILKPFLRS